MAFSFKPFSAKNVEIYIGRIDNAIDIAARGNNLTIAGYVDAQITATNISDFQKISDGKNSFELSPAEDDKETKNYVGADSSGSQNSETYVTANNETDITIEADESFGETLLDYALTEQGITVADVSDYSSFVLGSKSTEDFIMFVRVKKQIGAVHYFKNFAVVEPDFSSFGNISPNGDDTTASTSYGLAGNKTKIFVDHYNDTIDEVLVNF